MGISAGIKWMVREGTGVGATKRFGWLIIRETCNPLSANRDSSGKIREIHTQFLNAAASVVKTYGPPWARRSILGRALGIWLLVLLWIVPPSILAASAACKSHKMFRAKADRFRHGVNPIEKSPGT
jgi:hypothetical protein